MVEFKTLKYKHQRRARELADLDAQNKLNEDEATEFVMGLVLAWDFIDADTGEPIPPGEFEELSLEQYNEVMSEFNQRMEGIKATVPKASASPSRSGSTRSNRRKTASR